MELSIANQVNLFLIFILNGVIIGVIFDIFRILRRTFKTSNFITYIEDIMFWIITAFIIMYSIFKFNNGEFRSYIFLGIFLGVIIYILFFSKYIIKISVKSITILKNIFLFLHKILRIPINLLYKIIAKLVLHPINRISTKFYLLFQSFVKKAEKKQKNKISQE